jgi:hypothetical protein
MSRKQIAIPDSDQTAREPYDLEEEQATAEDAGEMAGRQTSNKSGKHSSAEKLAASRPDFGPAARERDTVPGAHGDASTKDPSRTRNKAERVQGKD